MKTLITWFILAALLAGGSAALAQSGAADILTGTSWQLQSYGQPGAPTAAVPGSTVTLTFEANGQISGNGGCNSFSGQYAVQGNTITIDRILSTVMACADGAVTQQEQAFLDGLQSAGWFDLGDNQLTIEYGGGQQLAFTPLTAPPAQDPPPFENVDSPVALLASYYDAINRRDYQRAYGYWETPPNPYDSFANGFATTTSVQVIIEPPTDYQGAAGSTYVSIPTVLLAQHSDGTLLTFAGCFVVRKSNLVPPDIPQPDVWHLYSADVAQVPSDLAIPSLLEQACQGTG